MLGIVTSVKQKPHEFGGNFRSVMYYHCIEDGAIGKNVTVINILLYSEKGCKVICGQPNSYISGNLISIEDEDVKHVYFPNESQLEELKLLLQLEKNYLMDTLENLYDIETREVVKAIENIIDLCETEKNSTNKFPMLIGDFVHGSNYSNDTEINPRAIADINDYLKKLSASNHQDDTNPMIHQLHP